MSHKEKFAEIISLQLQFNDLTTPHWVEKANSQEYHYRTAACQEVAEVQKGFGFAWWKPSEKNAQEVLSEMVDTGHLLISMNMAAMFLEAKDATEVVDVLSSRIASRFEQASSAISGSEFSDTEMRTAMCNLMHTVAGRPFAEIWPAYFEALLKLNMFDQFFDQFKAKNQLNLFRFARGYQEGTYQKDWYSQSGKMSDSLIVLQFTCLNGYDSVALATYMQDMYDYAQQQASMPEVSVAESAQEKVQEEAPVQEESPVQSMDLQDLQEAVKDEPVKADAAIQVTRNKKR